MRSEVLGSLVVILSLGATGCSRDSAAPSPTDKEIAATPAKRTPLLVQHDDPKFAPGQMWKISGKHRDARLVILRVERAGTGEVIVHGAVERDDSTKRIAHMPFDRAAIDGSVTELAGKAELPPYEEGYEHWRDAFEKGEAGWFTISVEEAIDIILQTVEQQAPQE